MRSALTTLKNNRVCHKRSKTQGQWWSVICILNSISQKVSPYTLKKSENYIIFVMVEIDIWEFVLELTLIGEFNVTSWQKSGHWPILHFFLKIFMVSSNLQFFIFSFILSYSLNWNSLACNFLFKKSKKKWKEMARLWWCGYQTNSCADWLIREVKFDQVFLVTTH